MVPDKLKPIDASGVHHVAINVRNLDHSAEFYTKLLGLHKIRRTGFLQVLAKGAVSLHLFQSPDPSTAKPPPNWKQLGVQHVALRVLDEDLDAINDRITLAGITTQGPLDNTDGRALYIRDPDGTVIELCAARPSPEQERSSRKGANLA